MTSVLDQLLEMGFPKEKAEAAVSVANGSLESAIDWIMNSGNGSESTTNEEKPETANSFKCNDCDKLFRDENAMMFHATKSGHENFSESSEEIKPLTAEEREAKAKDLRERIKAHRAKKDEQEKEEALDREKRRREEGKLMLERREQQKNDELRAIAEERKRQKLEDQEAKKRVLEQIRLDKEARKNRELGITPPEPAASSVSVAPPPVRDYNSTTLQIRLANGQSVKQTFKAEEPLAAVRVWVQTNHTDGSDFALMTPFPRKVFTENDLSQTLKSLDLVPSASLVVTRPQ
ncbi:unnamed protein product [Caenorhabditis auriculariae]|uniref:UBX domain-containing protein n=1 Tax=Caenorhabditis auriculariae TaxID=2777116 RepID=A0A8S1HSW3_9PELO|nr:unnamed protein product [Caenorhabditis auriculariae]